MKKPITLLLLTILAISFASFASADTPACFRACFTNGDVINWCNPVIPDETCGATLCEKFVTRYNEEADCYTGGCGFADGPCNNFGGSNTTFDVTPPELTLTSPVNGSMFTSRSVLLEYNLNERANVFYKNDQGTFSRICNECLGDVAQTRTFDEGFNELVLKAVDVVGNEALVTVHFTVDSSRPRITDTQPDSGFADGRFIVQFKEENPDKLTLTYGNSFVDKELDLVNDCSTDDRDTTTCETHVDLSPWDGGSIQYWFNITDMAGNKDSSRPEELDVDITPPVLNSVTHEVDGRSVTLTLNITEANFDEAEFLDLDEDGARWKRLCSRLDDDGVCESRQNLDDGDHRLLINVTDDVGLHTTFEMDSFFTDSKAPKITDMAPDRGFADGNFMVEFTEDNPVSLYLNYGNAETGYRMEEINLETECADDGRDTVCHTNVNLLDYNEEDIECWFNITDKAGQTDDTDREELSVDVMAPILNSIDVEIDGKNGYFTLDIDEPNFDEVLYLDQNDDRPRWDTLCKKLDEGICEARESFSDGEHSLLLNITDEAGNYFSTTLADFLTDSKKPRIRDVEPSRGFASGAFVIEYQETNPRSLYLNYGNDANGMRSHMIDLDTECVEDGRDTVCETDVDLADYHDQEIVVYANITDEVGQTDMSRERDLDVDVVAPVIEDWNWTIVDGDEVLFWINITESNFDEVNYIDNEADRPRDRRLCSRLDDGMICEEDIRLSDGLHDLTITVLDEAGLSVEVATGPFNTE